MSTPVTTPVASLPPLVDDETSTVAPIKELACIVDMELAMVVDSCKALNCASCAAKAVSLCGLSGSCDVICVTSNFKKSAWVNVELEVAVVAVADIVFRPRIPSLAGRRLGRLLSLIPGRTSHRSPVANFAGCRDCALRDWAMIG